MSNPISYSRVDSFKSCPFKYKLRYVDGITVPPDNTNAANPLIIGTAIHKGIETDAETAIVEYNASFPIINDETENECIKFEVLIDKAKQFIRDNIKGEYTYELELRNDDFIGYIDLLVKFPDGTYGIYDFKYSNAVERYVASPQIHLYKYYFELLHPEAKVTQLGYILIPKTSIRIRKLKNPPRQESILDFRERLRGVLNQSAVQLYKVDYQPNKVIEHLTALKHVLEATEYPRKPCNERFCMFCDIYKYCQEGYTYMLPINEKRKVVIGDRIKAMFYGQPFTGKTTLANQFPSPIFLNTDGNINTFDSPCIQLKYEYSGPVLTRHPWEVFTDAIKDLQTEQHTFQTVVIDLVDDVFEMCRAFQLKKMNISHESESSFKAWDIVTTTFLETFKQVASLNMNVVLLSHENTSRDITKRNGDTITAIGPNMREKIAVKLAGFVDIVGRTTADDTGHYINFKSNDIVFGGGRIKIPVERVPSSYEEIKKLYAQATPPSSVAPQVTPQPAHQYTPQPVQQHAPQPVPVTQVTPAPAPAYPSTPKRI